MGAHQAVATSYRFAVVVQIDGKLYSQAVSLVLAGGLLAAFTGPSLATATKDWLSLVRFVGIYTSTMATNGIAVILLLLLDLTGGKVRG